ncbi:MAG: T9SS type A sorting domain-containing protein [Bacteroidales bacterium]|jgi:hypothetical protein|nr:T9SS type A sorting domain-containing protein [Bacteroidales bacterium]
MKSRIFLFAGFLIMSLQVSGQVFRIDIDQPEELRIFPGNDTTICKNHSIKLGADPAATGGTEEYIFFWSPSDGLDDPTIPNPIASPAQSTKYVLTVTDANGCSASDFIDITIDLCLGVENIVNEENISIFPNPAAGAFTISGLPVTGGKTRVIILNSTGSEISSEELPAGTETRYFDLSGQNLPKGVYIIRIMNSQLVLTRRVQLI